VIFDQREADLLEINCAPEPIRRLADLLDRGEQQPDEHRDDREDDEKLK
jgi:hypothetical protein